MSGCHNTNIATQLAGDHHDTTRGRPRHGVLRTRPRVRHFNAATLVNVAGTLLRSCSGCVLGDDGSRRNHKPTHLAHLCATPSCWCCGCIDDSRVDLSHPRVSITFQSLRFQKSFSASLCVQDGTNVSGLICHDLRTFAPIGVGGRCPVKEIKTNQYRDMLRMRWLRVPANKRAVTPNSCPGTCTECQLPDDSSHPPAAGIRLEPVM